MKRFKLLPLVLAICFFMVQGVIAADKIPIGVPIPMTGWAAGSGADYFNGIKMSVDEINESGGLLGKQIEILARDKPRLNSSWLSNMTSNHFFSYR